MATIKYVKTPDGVTHNIGGGGGSSTYTLTKSGNTITLTGSGGDVSSVVDSNTTYSISISGNTITLTPSSGTAQSVTVPDNDTTYTIGISGSTITLTPSSGSAQTITIPDATTSVSGVMSSSDKTKLDGIASGAEVNVQSDWSQTDTTADDYIKNKPTIPTVNNGKLTIQKNGTTVKTFTANQSGNVTANITVPTNTSDLTNDSDFVSDATYVHTDNNFTNAYVSKLNGIESGAEVNVQSNWTQSDSTADDFIKNKPTLATVATTGDYDDLTNKPTIPTVNNGTLTIQKNGTTVDTFTANQSGNTTANITVPTATSDLTNDSNYVSDANYVHTDNNYTNADASKLSGISPNATAVSVTQVLSTGTKIAEIDVDGTTTDLYAPSGGGGGGSVDDVQVNGVSVVVSGIAQVTVPTATSDLTNDSNFVSDASYVHTDNNFTNADVTKLSGIASGAEVNVQSDWNETNSTSDAFIKNKPTIPTKNLWYGASSTGAATQAKTATTTSGNFALVTGNMVRIKFDNANTYNGTATLNVDGAGAVDIARVGTTKTTRYYWTAGEVVDFVYDGTNFVMSDKGTATTTYYGLTKLSSSTSSTSTALAATPSAVKAAYDLANSKVSDVEVNGTSVVSGGVASVTVPTKTSDLTNDSNFIPFPSYNGYTDIYNHTGIVTETFVTIPDDGWYLIDLVGAWSATTVRIRGTAHNIAVAQVRTNNVYTNTANVYAFKAGTELRVSINAAEGSAIIRKIL